MNFEKKNLSIIVPTYNIVENDCKLDWLIGGGETNSEIIFIDDASTDTTYEYLSDLMIKNSKGSIRLVRNTRNIGAGSTRNHGLSLASGDYIYFLDADDFVDKFALFSLVNRMEIEDTDVAIFNHEQIRSGRVKSYAHKNAKSIYWNWIEKQKVFPLYPLEKGIIFEIPNYPWNKIISHKFARQINLRFNSTHTNNDILAHWMLLSGNPKLTIEPNKIYRHVTHNSANRSITNISDERRFSIFDSLYETWKYLLSSQVTPEIRARFIRFSMSLLNWATKKIEARLNHDFRAQKHQLISLILKETDHQSFICLHSIDKDFYINNIRPLL